MLWRHIEYYFVHCEPIDKDKIQLDLTRTPTIHARRLQGIDLFNLEFFDISLTWQTQALRKFGSPK